MSEDNLTVELKLEMSDLINESDKLIGEIEELRKERDEAVAHINRMREEWEKNDADKVSTEEKLELLVDLLYGEPSKSLAKRGIIKQAEALEEFADNANPNCEAQDAIVNQAYDAADKLRQQAKELSEK